MHSKCLLIERMFKKILIANRGEIAVRVIRACHEMGIAAVAVYSEVDRGALHVRCADAGVKFIGPSAAPMEMMGSKTRARQAIERAGIPLVPGTASRLRSFEHAEQIAAQVGYPVMLKAAAGGGGKGMRLVDTVQQLHSALESARSEAERAFGDDEVYLEKAILNPRHIEMQVLADQHGNT